MIQALFIVRLLVFGAIFTTLSLAILLNKTKQLQCEILKIAPI
jgi:hypothetical protein